MNGDSTSWTELQHAECNEAFLNWDNKHWTVLCRAPEPEGGWHHVNSITGDALRYGIRHCANADAVDSVLSDIRSDCPHVTMHQIVPAPMGLAGNELEPEGRRFFMGAEEEEAQCEKALQSASQRPLRLVPSMQVLFESPRFV